ncbi:MAG: hypothetical protein OXT65_09605 [Alphaproteobacteria bacterium]|nr:hypothetical protein [Alphaproteobacteria bacterium]
MKDGAPVERRTARTAESNFFVPTKPADLASPKAAEGGKLTVTNPLTIEPISDEPPKAENKGNKPKSAFCDMSEWTQDNFFQMLQDMGNGYENAELLARQHMAYGENANVLSDINEEAYVSMGARFLSANNLHNFLGNIDKDPATTRTATAPKNDSLSM